MHESDIIMVFQVINGIEFQIAKKITQIITQIGMRMNFNINVVESCVHISIQKLNNYGQMIFVVLKLIVFAKNQT